MGYSLVTYDIQADSTRASLAKRLEQSGGIRVQRSVFVISLPRPKIGDMESWAREKMKDGDSLLVLPFCASCLDKARITEANRDKSLSVFI